MSVLTLKDVSYSYDKRKMVIKNMNLDFEEGTLYATVGESDAGKTTLLSMLPVLPSLQWARSYTTGRISPS